MYDVYIYNLYSVYFQKELEAANCMYSFIHLFLEHTMQFNVSGLKTTLTLKKIWGPNRAFVYVVLYINNMYIRYILICILIFINLFNNNNKPLHVDIPYFYQETIFF